METEDIFVFHYRLARPSQNGLHCTSVEAKARLLSIYNIEKFSGLQCEIT